MRVGVLVTRRAEYAAQAVLSARRFTDLLIVGLHGLSGPEGDITFYGTNYADLFNRCLGASPEPCVLKLDDHDSYPADHDRMLDYWKPRHTVWGMADIRVCDGALWGRRAQLPASVVPVGVYEPNTHGQIGGSVRRQTRALYAESGVTVRRCANEWSWPYPCPYSCPHAALPAG